MIYLLICPSTPASRRPATQINAHPHSPPSSGRAGKQQATHRRRHPRAVHGPGGKRRVTPQTVPARGVRRARRANSPQTATTPGTGRGRAGQLADDGAYGCVALVRVLHGSGWGAAAAEVARGRGITAKTFFFPKDLCGYSHTTLTR